MLLIPDMYSSGLCQSNVMSRFIHMSADMVVTLPSRRLAKPGNLC
jgi:hypothetical protein